MLGILQERMLGVIRHLTHTFNIFLFFSWYVAVNLEPCFWTVLQPLQELLPQREKPRIHVSNLQTNVCQISNRKSNLAEADLHQCQKTVMMAQHSSRHCMQVLSQQTGCSTWMFPGLSEKLTPVGFEPTPLRTGAWSQRLRPLGQSVHVSQDTAAIHWKTYWWLWLHDCLRQQMTFWCLSCACCGHGFWPYSRKACSVSKLTSCTIFWEGSDVSGRVAVLFLQSRPVVLDWVHTPGEHAQCHKTRNSHIEKIHFLFGLMAAGSLLHSMQESMISLWCWPYSRRACSVS